MSRTLPLLRLDVGHGYFADGRARGLRFEPADDTARRLRRADMLDRQDGASLWLLGPAEGWTWLDEDDPSALTWLVRATDPQFPIYTEDEASRPQELLMVEVPSPSRPPSPEPLAPTVRVMPVIRPEDGQPADGYALSGDARWRPPFAVLQLLPSRLRSYAPSAAQAEAGPVHLRWTLQPRRMVWKYCLFGDWSEDALDIHDPDGAVSFYPPAAEQLDNGSPLLALRSRAPIALAERSQARLQLRCRQAGQPKVLVKRLPVPGPRHLAREEIDGAATLVSEIHVHR
ncbi:hypothetical protein OU995_18080 [Roseateles sp. SL47]|uniref:hypothetical protein n=1 Tax=Roseateles sp. SL47 TaxID=2995138 RepID=UPI0022703A49|nr:hypothetical protein [Roseateles sp. SL47]WAC71483.1 hypothetical protein OU995_18080 [Roseateles sp. SL47]